MGKNASKISKPEKDEDETKSVPPPPPPPPSPPKVEKAMVECRENLPRPPSTSRSRPPTGSARSRYKTFYAKSIESLKNRVQRLLSSPSASSGEGDSVQSLFKGKMSLTPSSSEGHTDVNNNPSVTSTLLIRSSGSQLSHQNKCLLRQEMVNTVTIMPILTKGKAKAKRKSSSSFGSSLPASSIPSSSSSSSDPSSSEESSVHPDQFTKTGEFRPIVPKKPEEQTKVEKPVVAAASSASAIPETPPSQGPSSAGSSDSSTTTTSSSSAESSKAPSVATTPVLTPASPPESSKKGTTSSSSSSPWTTSSSSSPSPPVSTTKSTVIPPPKEASKSTIVEDTNNNNSEAKAWVASDLKNNNVETEDTDASAPYDVYWGTQKLSSSQRTSTAGSSSSSWNNKRRSGRKCRPTFNFSRETADYFSPVAPPSYLDYGVCNRPNNKGGSRAGRGTQNAILEKLKNVDVIEEIDYGGREGEEDPEDDEYDYYTVCDACGDMELVESEKRPVKYCRRQRFNFEREDDGGGETNNDGPPFRWESPTAPSPSSPCCSCPCCRAGLRRDCYCDCQCCCMKGPYRVYNDYDEIPVGKGRRCEEEEEAHKCKSRDPCGGDDEDAEEEDKTEEEDAKDAEGEEEEEEEETPSSVPSSEGLLPPSSGVYFFDAEEQTFIPQEPRTPSPVVVDEPQYHYTACPTEVDFPDIDVSQLVKCLPKKRKPEPKKLEATVMPPVYAGCDGNMNDIIQNFQASLNPLPIMVNPMPLQGQGTSPYYSSYTTTTDPSQSQSSSSYDNSSSSYYYSSNSKS